MRQRMMQQEGQYRMADLAYRNLAEQAAVRRYEAQQQHWNTLESQNANNERMRETNATNEASLRQGQLDQAAAAEKVKEKQGLFTSAIALNSTGQLSDDDRDNFNDWLSNDEHFGSTGLQLSKPDPSMQKNNQRLSAVGSAVAQAQQYRALQGQTDDEDQAKQYGNMADMLESWVKKQATGATFTPTETQNTYDEAGHKLTSRKTAIAPPPTPGAPGTGATNPAAGAPPMTGGPSLAPTDPRQRQAGQTYRSPADPTRLVTWTGNGWVAPNSP